MYIIRKNVEITMNLVMVKYLGKCGICDLCATGIVNTGIVNMMNLTFAIYIYQHIYTTFDE